MHTVMSTCRIGFLAHHTACLGRSCTGPLSNVTSPLSGHARPGLRILHPRPPATQGRQQCVAGSKNMLVDMFWIGSCRCLIRDSDAAGLMKAYLPHEFRSCRCLRCVACACAERRAWLPLRACIGEAAPAFVAPARRGAQGLHFLAQWLLPARAIPRLVALSRPTPRAPALRSR